MHFVIFAPPPGHHAGSSRAPSFCIFNNVAIAAAHAIEHHGLLRVAIADFDVHHGNGTEDIFHDDPRVMLCSTFRHPYYPNCGADSGNDHIINVPLTAGSSGIEFRTAVTEKWLPTLDDVSSIETLPLCSKYFLSQLAIITINSLASFSLSSLLINLVSQRPFLFIG